MAKKNLLKEYHRKRDFSLTKEPAGKKVTTRKKKLSFVVQEHHASHLHYDFRLELEGVLKSWAVPKGPSLDPATKRLAVQTEDHPLEYGKFHGTIPQGEYGGGEVFIWDKGSWEPEAEFSDASKALEKGHIKFRLKGKKLNGSFILVRTNYKGSGDKKNWLLIKHRDEFAITGEGAEVLPVKKASSKKKALKKKVPLIKSDPWPDFIPPQLPKLITQVPEEGGDWIHEMKYDGYRIQCHLQNGIGLFYTRNGLNWSNSFPHLLNAAEKLPVQNAIFDGEIVALDEEGRSHFQRLQNSLTLKKDKALRYYIFDLLYLNGKDLRALPLIERKELLEEILAEAPDNILYSEHLTKQGEDFYNVSCEHQLEGIVSKLADSPYHSGRNDLWAKIKCTSRQEFIIVGWSDPKGGRQGIGSLLLAVYEEGKLRYAGRVGTGLNQQSLKSIKAGLGPLEAKKTSLDLNVPKGNDIHWVKPKLVCEVSFSQWTDKGILRTPVFLGLRKDKSPNDILEEKAEPMVQKKTKKNKHLKLAREISSPEKILFKAEKKTKLDVAQFYQSIARHMLPYFENRPLSLVRCPNGSEGTCFYQKHFTGNIPESFHSFQVKEEKGQGTYISIDSAEGLMELVQLNAFEIHAWNCQQDDYLTPDQIVMDFDPGPGVEWNQVIEAAFELKDMLEALNLKSFVKLTGGKGVHVHIPVAPIYDWDQIKSFAQSLALELVHRNPRLYVANMAKNQRKKKIFVDYLRNGYGATAVVPYSLRARPTSAIALPLEWTELRRVKSGGEFTMDRALKKIKSRSKDPWAGMLKLKQKINVLDQVIKVKKKSA